ncbi:cobyric acid synthase [Methylocystis echinoides]|uniref:Cobyric acid synthase n=1 Tax=Methylocystis echinoides TaxID=29468 RepID=A0A9W6LQV6_9HYPH|nr:cobyric acid synthase [Methylocystis echinoides]GLI91644.1 cobyric acid synthase [Methylocystis echinoides]
MSRKLMIQGTGSDVGKSLVVAGLARAFANRGLRVAPFKPQNMSNNAAVTADGGEIGRAQALQARAARLAPSVDMNPVLLKPQGGNGSQVVVRGVVAGQAKARDYQDWKPRLKPAVMESFARLSAARDLVIIEGAGSAAEVNLRANDIANMGFARDADAPVVLVGDIDRGGVIAQLVGCKVVLDDADAAMIEGFIVNKFRGDPTLFEDGMRFVAARTGWRALGLVPYFEGAARLPAEDAFGLRGARATKGAGVVIAAPLLPHIANFDDLDPLKAESGVDLRFIAPGDPLPAEAALVILPGSKATIADLAALRANGWDIDLFAHVRRGGRVFGVCGGYQMLGRLIRDPHGMEGDVAAAPGLGLLDIETVLTDTKTLVAVSGRAPTFDAPFHGYEMHVGETAGPDCAQPLLRFEDGRVDGAQSRDLRVMGAYVHGLFADDALRAAFLARIGAEAAPLNYEQSIDETLDALAAHCEKHIDLDALWEIAR